MKKKKPRIESDRHVVNKVCAEWDEKLAARIREGELLRQHLEALIVKASSITFRVVKGEPE